MTSFTIKPLEWDDGVATTSDGHHYAINGCPKFGFTVATSKIDWPNGRVMTTYIGKMRMDRDDVMREAQAHYEARLLPMLEVVT